MALYKDLYSIYNDSDMINRASIAVLAAAKAKLVGTPTPEEMKWAASVAADPRPEGTKAYRLLLVDNIELTTEQIKTAADSVLQSKIDALVNTLVIAHNI